MANCFSKWIASLALCALLAASAHGQATDKIVIDGSTGVLPLAESLARAFQERNPGVTVELGKGLGTKARLQALAEGRIDVAVASHGLNAEEISRSGLTVHEIAQTAVVFGVHAAVPVDNVTAQQVCDVYAGKITNWKALGGPGLEIAPRTRPETEVDAEQRRGDSRRHS